MVDFYGYFKTGLVFLVLGLLTSFICSYSLCGILSNKACAFSFGAAFIILTFFHVYLATINREIKEAVLLTIVSCLQAVGAICCIYRGVHYFTSLASSHRFFLAFFISLPLFASIALQLPFILRKFFNEVYGSITFPSFYFKILFLISITLISIFTALLNYSFKTKIEQDMVKLLAAREMAACFIGAFIIAFAGIFAAYKSDYVEIPQN